MKTFTIKHNRKQYFVDSHQGYYMFSTTNDDGSKGFPIKKSKLTSVLASKATDQRQREALFKHTGHTGGTSGKIGQLLYENGILIS